MNPKPENEITSNLTIRGLPSSVRKTLAARAKARRMSLNAYVIELLTLNAQTPTTAEDIADIDAIRRRYGLTGVTSEDVVAAARQACEERDAEWD